MAKNYGYTRVCCYIGYLVQAIVCNFLPLLFVTFNTQYNISYDMLGTLIVLNFGTQIAVDVLSVKFVNKFGYHNCAMLAHIFAAVGLAAVGILPKFMPFYPAMIISVFLYALGSGFIEVIISPIIEYLPSDEKSGGMSLLHSFYCWGQVLTVAVTTFLFFALGRERWDIIAIIWAAVPFVNLILFIRAPIVVPKDATNTKKNKEILRSGEFYVLLLIMICAGASELAVSQWASAFAEQALGVSKSVGDLAGPCAFAIFMGVGRLIYGIWGSRIDAKKAMLFCATLCLITYLVISLSGLPALSLVFCAICGFSVSIMWPATISMSSARFVSGGTLMFGLLAAFGDIGCSVGPWVTSMFADRWSLNIGFLASSVFPFLMIISIIYLMRKDFVAKS